MCMWWQAGLREVAQGLCDSPACPASTPQIAEMTVCSPCLVELMLLARRYGNSHCTVRGPGNQAAPSTPLSHQILFAHLHPSPFMPPLGTRVVFFCVDPQRRTSLVALLSSPFLLRSSGWKTSNHAGECPFLSPDLTSTSVWLWLVLLGPSLPLFKLHRRIVK